jgi:hypothetical protein
MSRSTSVKKKQGRDELYKMHISIPISAAPKDVTNLDQWNGSVNGLEGADRFHKDVLNPPLAGRALHGNPAVPYTLPLTTLRDSFVVGSGKAWQTPFFLNT